MPWQLDTAHTEVGFEVRHMMVSKVRGRFTDVAAEIHLDDAQPANLRVEATIGAASVTTGAADRDGHLKSADFFDVENTNDLTFVSTGIVATGDDFVVTGNLTIKGVTQPVELAVELGGIATDPFGNVRAGFEGKGEISRKEFGLTWNVALEAGGVLVSDTIKLQLDISAIKQG